MFNRFSYFLILTSMTVCVSAAGLGGKEIEAASEGDKLTDAERQEAKNYFISGSEAYSKKDYKTAIDQFRKAFELVRSPEILFNIGRCHEELGETEDAIYHYEMYLRFYPTAEDAEDVKHRINVLREVEERKHPEGTKERSEDIGELYEDVEPETERQAGIRLGAAIGFRVPVTGEWALRTVIPVEVIFHVPLLDWLFLTGVGMYGAPVYGDEPKDPGEITSLLGIMVGANAIIYSGKRVELEGGIGIMPTRVARHHYDNATWLAFPATLDVIIKVYEGLRIIAGVSVDFGPVFNRSNYQGDAWTSAPSPTFDVGGRIFGVEYMFL
jgi:hypothetical protein